MEVEPYYHIYMTPTSEILRDESYDHLEAIVYAPPKIFTSQNLYMLSDNTFMFKIFQYVLKKNSSKEYYDFKNFLSDYGATFDIGFPEVPRVE